MPESRSRPRRVSRRVHKRVIPLELIPDHRIRMVFGILCVGLFGLMGRIAWLQIFQAPQLEAKARAHQTSKTEPLGTRRSIVDRKGRLIAIDEERFRIWAHPNNFHFLGDDNSAFIRTPVEVARKLSSIISIPVHEIVARIGDKQSGVRLVEGLDASIASKIRELGISGLDIERYPYRVYPQGTLFANVVGFLDQDRIPQAGLEQSLQRKLLKKEHTRSFRRGADGTPLPHEIVPGSLFGDDLRLQLTLDVRLQDIAMKSLTAEVKKRKAKKGVAIVMNVGNGELLALASTPTYNPNNYWDYSPALFREWSVQDLYEPGSTFKPINLALALQEGVINPTDKVQDKGILRVGGWSIQNHDKKANGLIGFDKVLQVSSNVGMAKTMSKLNASNYWDWLQKLGLDSVIETDLPGAVPGQLKSKATFVSQSIEPVTASFGQGFSLTPIKLAQLHALLANDGYLVNPHITRGLIKGNSLLPSSSLSKNQLLSPEVTKTIRSWMESVVEEGSGKGVLTPGYRIGGKTGTAEKAVNGVYKSGSKICSFVAILPIDDPKYVVLVVIDEPKGSNAYGSTVAVPVTKEIIDGLLVLEKIAPTQEQAHFQTSKI